MSFSNPLFTRRHLPLFLAALLSLVTSAQPAPALEWESTFGGLLADGVLRMALCSDGSYIMLGQTTSTNGIAAGNHGGYDLLVVKVDATGTLAWSRCLGGTENEFPGDIKQTSDGGFIIAASSNSNDGDVSGNLGDFDLWMVKLDGGGEILWQRCLGGLDLDGSPYTVEQLDDGGYYVAASSRSNDGDALGSHGSSDYWVLRLDAAGAPVWTRMLGGSGYDACLGLRSTPDGGCIVTGETGSSDGDVTMNHGESDTWVAKLDAAGTLEWQRSYGGSGTEMGWAICLTPSGGYALAGSSSSNDGDVSTNHGADDFWLAELDPDGEIIWESSYGGSGIEMAFCIQPTADNGFVAIGGTSSMDGQVTGYHGGDRDVWAIKVDHTGALVWQSTFGGSAWDQATDIHATPDGGYIFAGGTTSSDGDVSVQHGQGDAWVVKLGPDYTGLAEHGPVSDLSLVPNPSTGHVAFNCTLLEGGQVDLAVLNSQGQQVLPVFHGHASPGLQQWHFDLQDLAPGVYLLRFVSAGQTLTRRLVRQ